VPARPGRYENEIEKVYDLMFKKKGYFYNELKNIARECII
jgi:hypothetical protein